MTTEKTLPPPKPPVLFDIPAGTEPSKCVRCPATIYWSGKQPLRAEKECHHFTKDVRIPTPDACAPTDKRAGKGFSHFIDCPQANAFRRTRS